MKYFFKVLTEIEKWIIYPTFNRVERFIKNLKG